MKLCITEKPSVGRDIARILGADVRHDGYFEGSGYCVTWTFGHLCCLKEPADYSSSWKRWTMGSLPMIPPKFGIKLIDQPSIKRQFDTIRNLIGEAEEIINCGDAGQEGELIQRWVMQLAKCNVPVKRLWISSLTDESIKEGFKNLRSHKDLEPLYTAGLCRAIGDWMLGINATRLYSLKYGCNGQVLSIGRVQTPTLALVVNRQREIENFVPSTYWELKTTYRSTLFSAAKKSYDSEEKAAPDIAAIKDLPFVVEDVSKKKGKEAPPRLFDLTSLQVECNRKFNMSADETLRTIQSLYEKKATTYPRVDTTYLTDDMYPKCGKILNSLSEFQNLLTPIRGARLKKSKKVFDNSKVTDHHAIIPTGERLANLSPTEKQVYDLIALRFISVFFPDCEFEQTTVKGKAGKIEFKANGKVILKAGWKALFAKEDKSASDSHDQGSQEDTLLPEFTKGESGPHEPKLVSKTTQPPKYYTEGTLLKAMETAGTMVEDEDLREALKANGIGRPSTRAAIIEILYKRGYIRKERKSIRATKAAEDLIDIINEDLLKSAKLTGIWEGRLRQIERGDYSAPEFIAQLKQLVNQITINVLKDNSNLRIDSAKEKEPQVSSRKTGKQKKAK